MSGMLIIGIFLGLITWALGFIGWTFFNFLAKLLNQKGEKS
ncbi:MAG: hypothetical protein MRECE_2c125 [Mycoplasmataceae bacterium CE_OT135]|nr:MAG: hypothetical protein MRECE_2c125 [Mycoplasmataceae bacterium CE_OT135]